MRVFFLCCLLTTGVFGADWPSYRADATRSGYSPDELPDELVLEWKCVASQAPRPAWNQRERAPGDEDQGARLQFDMVFQPIVAGGVLYFGSSADDQVRALDARTGREKWSYFTGGPVRLAPEFWRDALYVTSDDGFLHCLEAATGKLKWKLSGSPETDHVLGNGRMISRWPCRGAAVIRDGIVYFGAGTWPSEKTYVIAADALTGKLEWRYCNEVADPQDGEDAQFKFTAQGYPAIGSDRLVVPAGRISSYYFDRRDGSYPREYTPLSKTALLPSAEPTEL